MENPDFVYPHSFSFSHVLTISFFMFQLSIPLFLLLFPKLQNYTCSEKFPVLILLFPTILHTSGSVSLLVLLWYKYLIRKKSTKTGICSVSKTWQLEFNRQSIMVRGNNKQQTIIPWFSTGGSCNVGTCPHTQIPQTCVHTYTHIHNKNNVF